MANIRGEPPIDDISILHDMFYVSHDGRLLRKARVPRQTIKPGDLAGKLSNHGRMVVRLNGFFVYAHQIVWAMTHGVWPMHEIDHVNGIPTDNRPSNLRKSTCSQNQFNRPVRKISSSGLKGVGRYGKQSTWRVQVTANGVRHCIYNFTTAELAYDFACLLRFHLHGEFAHD